MKLPFTQVQLAFNRLVPMLAVLCALLGTACEDKAIGRRCDLGTDGGGNKSIVSVALECPARICVQPAVDINNPNPVDTTALCSADCSKDSDCSDGQKRGKSNPFGCQGGFACGVAVEVGDFCCKKLCLCKDFLVIPDGGLTTPAGCNPDNPINKSVCKNLPR